MAEQLETNPNPVVEPTEAAFKPMTRGDLQRAHARFVVQSGDVACEGIDTISVDPQQS